MSRFFEQGELLGQGFCCRTRTCTHAVSDEGTNFSKKQSVKSCVRQPTRGSQNLGRIGRKLRIFTDRVGVWWNGAMRTFGKVHGLGTTEKISPISMFGSESIRTQ
jgi:hypothetical protein